MAAARKAELAGHEARQTKKTPAQLQRTVEPGFFSIILLTGALVLVLVGVVLWVGW